MIKLIAHIEILVLEHMHLIYTSKIKHIDNINTTNNSNLKLRTEQSDIPAMHVIEGSAFYSPKPAAVCHLG